MPALPAVARVVRVQVRGLIRGARPWQNGFHLQYTGTAPGVSDLNTLAASIGTAYVTNFGPVIYTGNSVESVVLADLTSPLAASGESGFAGGGARTGTSLTAQVACVVSWDINVRYRGGHPRTYHPAGVIADAPSAVTWNGSFVTEMLAAATAFRTAMNALTTIGATYTMVTVSYFNPGNQPGVIRPVPAVYTVQGARVRSRIDTQRRRLGKELV